MKALMKTKPLPGLELGEVPIPRPQGQDVLIKVAATGICGSDIHIYEWTSGYEWLIPYFPLVLGHEFSGTVAETGSGVKNLSVGDRVVCIPGKPCGRCFYCLRGDQNLCVDRGSLGLRYWGSFAEYICVPEQNCLMIPGKLSFVVAALAEPLAVALNGLQLSGSGLADYVAVLGPGPIGLMVAYLAKQAGARRVILAGRPRDTGRLDIGRQLGADIATSAETGEVRGLVMEETGGIGADVVFEAAGSPAAVSEGLQLLRKGGTLVVVGIHAEPVSLWLNDIVRQEKKILGSYGSRPGLWRAVLEILAGGERVVGRLITHRFPLDKALQGFQAAHQPGTVKVMITSNPS
ncbi:hypothetical protein SY88_15570 [Clostridiales bacterium PH28_bin88]|nr:hypothetical protein SY88_15570 [Clostridiales bacterium PH28_bin88]